MMPGCLPSLTLLYLVCVLARALCALPEPSKRQHLPSHTPVLPHLPGVTLSLHQDYSQHLLPSYNRSVTEVRLTTEEGLVALLTSATVDINLYLLYDHTNYEVDGFVRSHQEVGSGDKSVTVVKYSEDLSPLQAVLTTTATHTGTRHVLVLCSTKNTQQIFQYVRERQLELPSLWWLVVGETDLSQTLQPLLWEGSLVTLAVRTSSTTYSIMISRVDSTGFPMFVPVGSWTLTPSGLAVQVQEPLVPDPLKLYSDMSGRQLIVTANNNWPFFGLDKFKDGKVQKKTGIDIEIMNTLGQFLNFTYHVVSPADGQWGGPLPDGTVSGLIGQVARREAHVAICEITVTGSRETVVDFTIPYYLETLILVSRAPAEKNRVFAVFSPFSVQVWLCIVASTVAIGPIVSLLGHGLDLYVSWPPRRKLRDYSFNMYRNMVTQGNLLTTPHWPHRLVFFFWYLFCFYIYALYSGTLTAVLALPAYEEPIDSLTDLPDAVADGFTVGTLGDSNIEYMFKEAKEGIYKEVWGLFNHKDRSNSFFKTVDPGFDQITRRKFVLMNPQLNSEVRAAQRGKDKYHLGRQPFYPQGYGIACNKGAPFIPKFNQMLTRISQAGLIAYWKEKEIQMISGGPPAQDSTTERGPSAITLKHLQAAFFVLMMGFIVAVLALGLEFVVSKFLTSQMGEWTGTDHQWGSQ